MSGIQTGIELNDHFTEVIYGIINAVNIAVCTMEDMQQAMDSDVDASAFEGMRNEINQATIAVDELNAALAKVNQGVTNTDVPLQIPTPKPTESPVLPEQSRAPPIAPVEIPVTWNTDGLEVFTGTGIERFQQEVQSTNNMLEQLSSTQDAIAKQAYNTNLFPPESFQNLNALAVRIDNIRERIQQIENNPVNIGTDMANTQLEQFRSQLNRLVQEQNELNAAMQNMDVSAANTAYLQLSQTVSGTERYIRDNVDEQGRFNQEISQGTQQADGLMNAIKGAVAAYVSIQSVGKVLNISDELTQTTSRLGMMNDGVHTTEELVNMVYAAAQDARGSFSEMADVVARFGNNAGDAFSSSEEVVAFADLVQKQMTIAGASTQEASNAMLQLSQALGSGVLRGDELNSIFEQAPNLIQSIADYLDVPIGQIREMASEGELSADVVKAAIFASADDINAKFEEMPMTWAQLWQSMQNTALMAFQPVLQRLNELANSEAVQNFVDGAIGAMATLANIVISIFDMVATVSGFIADNWSIISPIVYGVAAALAVYYAVSLLAKDGAIMSALASGRDVIAKGAQTIATFATTAAQEGFNAALAACPITWIIIAIIALVAIIITLCNWIAEATGVTESGFGIICGIASVAVAFILNQFIGLINMLITLGVNAYNCFANFAAAFGILFDDPVAAIKAVLLSLLNFVVTVVTKAAQLLDAVFGSNLADAVSEFQAKVQAEIDATIENAGGDAAETLNPSDYTLDRINYGDAFDAGAALGDGIADTVGNFSLSDLFGTTDIPNPDDYTSGFGDVIKNSGMGDNIADISDNTGAIKDSMDISNEDLKYLRDIAEQEAINRFTTAEIKIDMTTNNNVSSDTDLDGIVDGLTTKVLEAMETVKEGV